MLVHANAGGGVFIDGEDPTTLAVVGSGVVIKEALVAG